MSGARNDCCSSPLPPVVTGGYAPEGTYEVNGGPKTCKSPTFSSTRGIIDLYDAFGYFPQMLQGADRLAASLEAMAQEEWFTTDTTEMKAAYQTFGQEAEPAKHVGSLWKLVKAAREKYPDAHGWAGFGLCWGGKVVALASGPDTPFKASIQGRPGRVAREDAEKISIPHICLAASTDNEEGGVDAYAEVFSQERRIGHVETYGTMFHGWMGARANLEDEANAKKFERG
ncbi:hypothetical protein MMC08_005768 [Hypocenomyce scalaris]|nr:hypothetical protein [Hypocenomyce scalaris]